jgi:hypothetical protein
MDQLKKEGNKNMQTRSDWSALVSTNCECTAIDEEGNEIPEITPDYCSGCGDWMTEGALELLDEWQRLNEYPSAVIIQGVRMGWRSLSGYAFIREAGSDKISRELLNKLMLNGDFTLQFTLAGKTCTIKRTSHDEWPGAEFTLEAFTPCDGWSDCQATEGITEHEGQNLCFWCLDIELANQ